MTDNRRPTPIETAMLAEAERLEALADQTSHRIADSLRRIVARSQAPQAPAEQEGDVRDAVIDAIEETFLPQLGSKALGYCAQEDVHAGLTAMRERFQTDEWKAGERP